MQVDNQAKTTPLESIQVLNNGRSWWISTTMKFRLIVFVTVDIRDNR